MRPILNEEGEQIYSEAHARELLTIQSNYNKMLQELNNKLAKQKSDCSVKYMKIAQQQTATQNAAAKAKVATTPTTTTDTTSKQTGTVDKAGHPTDAKGNPIVEDYPDILRIKEIMPESLSESSYRTKNINKYELQTLKDYLDAESISYSEEEDGSEIDFDETELDREWQDKMKEMGFKEDLPETNDILSIEDETNDTDDITDTDEKIDEDKVFYVKIDDEGEAFVGKIYKLFSSGDWRAKVIDGNSDTFEKLNYDPNYDEFDIIAFLRENYADAELIEEDEFNDHVENPEAEPDEKIKENDHSIPTLDEFMNENDIADKLDKIYNHFLKVDISTIDKTIAINKSFLDGYTGKPLSININVKTPLYVAWKAGNDRAEQDKK